MTTPVSVITNYFGNQIWAQTLCANGGWLGLATYSPGVTGDPASELAGGGYLRQRATFANPSGKAVLLNRACTFVGMPASTIWGLEVWDSQVGGHIMVAQELDPHIVAAANSHFLVPSGTVALAL